MNYFNNNLDIYNLLRKVVYNTQHIFIEDTSKLKLTPYPRMEESNFIISEDLLKRNKSILTAHILEEYKPNKIKLERLMRESNILLIDILINDIGGVRGVPISSC